jgi:apolipoprotein N-acyltransferase
MKNWINKLPNQMFLFYIIVISLPLFLLDMCSPLTTLIVMILWGVGMFINIFFWIKSKNDK